jgi:hypothetical protein
MFLVKIKVILSRHSVVRFKSSMQKTYSIHHNSPCILSNRAEIVPLIYILDALYAQKFSGLQHLLWLRSSRGETFVVYCILFTNRHCDLYCLLIAFLVVQYVARISRLRSYIKNRHEDNKETIEKRIVIISKC